jgi:8-oxo-dGTP pyrophosphatase MutT (NUDIX family)
MSTDDRRLPSLREIVPDGVFVGTSLILRQGDRFLYGVRPAREEEGRLILELTGIGGGLESYDQSLAAGVLREAQEEMGCSVHLIPCSQTLIVRGQNYVEQVMLEDDERPAAVVFRNYRTPPHQPWHEDSRGSACLIVFVAELAGQPWPTVEHPYLMWLTPEQILATAQADLPLHKLLSDGAGLVVGEAGPPPVSSWLRLTDSQEALALALGEQAPAFYRSLATTVYLERIVVRLPNTSAEFTAGLAALLDVFGQRENSVLALHSSDPSFYPKLFVDFQAEQAGVRTDFVLSDGETISVQVENTTGLNKQSPHVYRPLSVEAVSHRLTTAGIRLVGIDHVGCNLPWFSAGWHPRIGQLRRELSARCLYHRFPTGEPWDFIIPGDREEIAKRKDIDYNTTRRPKFELVSFVNASTPLIQFDVGVNASYERFLALFPEALNDSEFRNVWLYLENPYPIDVCLVLNEYTERDWSDFFQGYRL